MIKTLKFVAAYLFAVPDGTGNGATLCGNFVALGQQGTFNIRRATISATCDHGPNQKLMIFLAYYPWWTAAVSYQNNS